jgi:hypothetical protein
MPRLVTVVLWMLAFANTQAQVERWSRTFDDALGVNVLTSIVVTDSGYCFVNKSPDFQNGGHMTFTQINLAGDTTLTRVTQITGANQYGGASQALKALPDARIIMVDSKVPLGSNQSDAALVLFGPDGDTLWTHSYGVVLSDALTAVDTVPGGYALFGTVSTGQYYDMRLIRTDTAGNVLWEQTYGGFEDQQCYSGQRTLDGGYVLSGFKYFNNDHVNMYVVKVDSAGVEQWDYTYGSPWIDNAGFIRQLPDSGYVLVGAQRISENAFKRAAIYRLDPSGSVVWSTVFDDVSARSVLYAAPVIASDGYVAAGDQNFGSITHGLLLKSDLVGNLVWRRTYNTTTQVDHYFYDLERTLDGGFIMAGTAFDSLLVSQDAWLVKVDSFGCLVPGCQIFDGLAEQFTDMGAALTLYPNPVVAGEPLNVQLALPAGFTLNGPLRLAMVSTDGRVVAERVFSGSTSSLELSTSQLSSGLYFLHVLDGSRWLCGGKVVVSE